MRSPGRTLPRAVVFDLDGTLYHQTPVRALIAGELAAHAAMGRLPAGRTARALRAFRSVREELRRSDRPGGALLELQFDEPARRLGESPQFIRQLVEEWMFVRPLKYLKLARRREIERLVRRLARDGVALGVLSDYPAEAKLCALGMREAFSLVLCTTDSEIDAFKPHPRGFLHACSRLDLRPHEVAYVGDRADVDAAGAAAAGMPCYLVDRQPRHLRARKDGLYGGELAELTRLCYRTV